MGTKLDSDSIKLAFGIPFYSIDFSGLMQEIGILSDKGGRHMFFAASMPWLMDYAKNPLLFPSGADYILAADSNLLNMLGRLDVKLKMPLEYFEFPEQIARICAHYGLSLMHVSESALKTDILVSDGFVPLSWELFTHFKTSGELDEIDARSIRESASDLNPAILLISAPPNSLHRFIPGIYAALDNCIVICIPQDEDKNRIVEKLDSVLVPTLLLRDELKFLNRLEHTVSMSLPSAVYSDETCHPASISVSGTLDAECVQEFLQAGNKLIDLKRDIALDLSGLHAVSRKGFEAIHMLRRKAQEAGLHVTTASISEQIQNSLHHAGLGYYLDDLPGILADMD
ncbi:STAS domain-containing protein [Maridesulfovibrio sp. FT414]|uniref:STAS domain-containing protein n=1 Tax=Maridesulfovibrio sp. FT414 TaxID=2979469 RepID=UPI003D808168